MERSSEGAGFPGLLETASVGSFQCVLSEPDAEENRACCDRSVERSLMRITRCVLFLVCSGALIVAAQNGADEGAVTKVLALEHAWNQAEQRKDAKAMDALFDNALVYVDYDGSFQTKAEFLARVKSSTSQPQQETTESMTAHMFGGTVIVTGIYVTKGVEKGKPYVRRGRFVDTWTLRNGSWLCVASQATPILPTH